MIKDELFFSSPFTNRADTLTVMMMTTIPTHFQISQPSLKPMRNFQRALTTATHFITVTVRMDFAAMETGHVTMSNDSRYVKL